MAIQPDGPDWTTVHSRGGTPDIQAKVVDGQRKLLITLTDKNKNTEQIVLSARVNGTSIETLVEMALCLQGMALEHQGDVLTFKQNVMGMDLILSDAGQGMKSLAVVNGTFGEGRVVKYLCMSPTGEVTIGSTLNSQKFVFNLRKPLAQAIQQGNPTLGKTAITKMVEDECRHYARLVRRHRKEIKAWEEAGIDPTHPDNAARLGMIQDLPRVEAYVEKYSTGHPSHETIVQSVALAILRSESGQAAIPDDLDNEEGDLPGLDLEAPNAHEKMTKEMDSFYEKPSFVRRLMTAPLDKLSVNEAINLSQARVTAIQDRTAEIEELLNGSDGNNGLLTQLNAAVDDYAQYVDLQTQITSLQLEKASLQSENNALENAIAKLDAEERADLIRATTTLERAEAAIAEAKRTASDTSNLPAARAVRSTIPDLERDVKTAKEAVKTAEKELRSREAYKSLKTAWAPKHLAPGAVKQNAEFQKNFILLQRAFNSAKKLLNNELLRTMVNDDELMVNRGPKNSIENFLDAGMEALSSLANDVLQSEENLQLKGEEATQALATLKSGLDSFKKGLELVKKLQSVMEEYQAVQEAGAAGHLPPDETVRRADALGKKAKDLVIELYNKERTSLVEWATKVSTAHGPRVQE